MMKVSQNQYAEILLKHHGRSQVRQVRQVQYRCDGCLRQARDVLQRWNIADDSLVIADGSGLSRYNFVSSEALVRVLQIMRADSRHRSAFVESLPIAGRDGTLSGRLAGTPAEGKVKAKTGTVDNVRAIAGYVETADGQTLVFSMIANNFTIANGAIDAAADRALIRLATFTTR